MHFSSRRKLASLVATWNTRGSNLQTQLLGAFDELNRLDSQALCLTESMAASSPWGRVGALRPFLGRFSYYLAGFLPWVPPAIWFNENIGEPTLINGPSMYPFLNDQFYGSLKRDLCWNYKLYAEQTLERGMVITFKYVILAHRPGLVTRHGSFQRTMLTDNCWS